MYICSQRVLRKDSKKDFLHLTLSSTLASRRLFTLHAPARLGSNVLTSTPIACARPFLYSFPQRLPTRTFAMAESDTHHGVPAAPPKERPDIPNPGSKRVQYYTPEQDPPAGTAMSANPPSLFTPLKIRDIELTNRVVVRT